VALLPWGALVVWLMRGHQERARVPFLRLWQTTSPFPRSNRSMRIPPAAVCCLLAALLLAILGAAGPTVGTQRGGLPITLVVDRDVTMSAKLDRVDRFRALQDVAIPALRETIGLGPTKVVAVPGGEMGDWGSGGDRLHEVQQLEPLAVRTRGLLESTIQQILQSSADPVVVLSDQQLAARDDRVVQISLDQRIDNVGIVLVAARQNPKPQVMVLLRNQSPSTQAELVVQTAGQSVSQLIDLPPKPGEARMFVDMPALGPVVSIQLNVDDDWFLSSTMTCGFGFWRAATSTTPTLSMR
jgi:hypothetical protein